MWFNYPMTDKKKADKRWMIAIAAVVVVFLGLMIGKGTLPSLFTTGDGDGSVILYHTLTCPHCQNVKEYIEENGITGITQKEISIDQAAANELGDRLTACGEDISQGIPVPVLWADGKCYVGEVESIDYLKTLNSQNEQTEQSN